MLRYLRSQMLDTRGEVNCGRFNIRVPHHLGEAVDIAAAFEHERRKGVPQHVRVKVNAAGVFNILDEVTEGCRRDRAVIAKGREKLRTSLSSSCTFGEVVAENSREHLADRHQAVFRTLAGANEDR